jgi:RNA polymerase sigma-70 factor (ECF subfamily)
MREQPSQSSQGQETKESMFISWYETHSDEIFRFALLRIRDREKALDITQETFTKLWDYLSKGKTEIKHARGIIFKIARNLIIDESRKASSHTLSLDSLIDTTTDNDSAQYQPEAPKSDIPSGITVDLERALGAIETLEPNHREIITLRFLHELSVEEISELIGINKNSVSVRIHRGLEALRKILGDADTFLDIQEK